MRSALVATGLWLAALNAAAWEAQLGGISFALKGNATAGVAVRVEDRNPEVLNLANAAELGLLGTKTGGRNTDDGNLNFAQGEAVSSPLKLYLELTARQGALTAVLGAKAWYDHTLETEGMPWGHMANGYARGRRLADAHAERRSRFSGVVLQEAYLQHDSRPAGGTLRVRLGDQVMSWGQPSLLGSPWRALDALDGVAAQRPGAIAAENVVPAPALRGTLRPTPSLLLDGFVQLAWRQSPGAICGTFFSNADYGRYGCNRAVIGAGIDPVLSTQAQSSLVRSDVVAPPAGGQFGLSWRYGTERDAWTLGMTGAVTHSKTPFSAVRKTGRSGANAANAPLLANNPGQLNATYVLEFPEEIRMLGAVATLRALGGSWSLEYVYTPNMPVSLNTGDLLTPFVTPATTAAFLRADERATPSGGLYHGWDRLKVSDLRLSFNRPWPQVLGASEVVLVAEAIVKLVHGLPEVAIRRYRRPDVYGPAAYPGSAACTGNEKQCSLDGYVSASAYALRVQIRGRFALGEGWILAPSLTLGRDIKGWSYDATLSEGRNTLVASLRLTQGPRFAELAVTRRSGAAYGNLDDRDHASAFIGTSF